MIKRFLIALIILGAFIGGLAYFQLVFKPTMIKQFLSSQVPPPATITAEAAKTEEWIERLPAIGTLIASQGVEVASQVAQPQQLKLGEGKVAWRTLLLRRG